MSERCKAGPGLSSWHVRRWCKTTVYGLELIWSILIIWEAAAPDRCAADYLAPHKSKCAMHACSMVGRLGGNCIDAPQKSILSKTVVQTAAYTSLNAVYAKALLSHELHDPQTSSQ